MSKILYITQRYAPAAGGAEIYVNALAQWNVKNGHEVDVWTSDALEADALWYPRRKKIDVMEEKIEGVHVRRFKTSPFFLNNIFINKAIRFILVRMPFRILRIIGSPPLCWEMLREVRKNDSFPYDIIHVSAMPYHILFYVGLLLAKKTGAKLYLTPFAHTGISQKDPLYKKYFDPLIKDFFKKADKVFVQTDVEQRTLSNFLEQKGVSLSLDVFQKVGLGVVPGEVLVGDRTRFRAKYGIDPDIPIVFYVGAREGVKGVYNLVNTCEILWKKGIVFKLVMGGNSSIAFEKFWDRRSEEVKSNSLVLERPSDEDKWDMFDAGDIFVMTSKSESFGIVYLEAWLYKKPVIGCNIEAVSEIIEEGEDGYLLPFDDSQALVEKIEFLLSNKEEAKRLGQNGYNKVMREYTWENKFKILAPFFNDKK
ncbi:MAG: Glycosyl transferase group 1 [candidate division WS6 bacterium GW2011_GWF2_39_15]|uniref:Glycosyl transferase group 1 n=1 Tax=candidate division WS6 bacterium GW2011_GWF2_39_15 TaxID=1619100 RepID=A0A0G0Q7Q8_9BACT|nr:MAG: Glycosyl transferase group 1 [candidate division WS6 bacterium GW2011_GWF2_39_15]